MLENSSDQPFVINIGDRIAQLILYEIVNPPVTQVDLLDNTTRGAEGFGSTGVDSATVRTSIIEPTTTTLPAQPTNIIDQRPVIAPTTVAEITDKILQEDGIKPYSIWLSSDPYDDKLTISIDIKGNHPSLGMQFVECPHRSRLKLADMALSTPGARLSKWRSTIKHAYLLEINGTPVRSLQEVHDQVKQARQNGAFKMQCVFATDKSFGIHPTEGSINLYFDQMNAFAQHIYTADEEHKRQYHNAENQGPVDFQDILPEQFPNSTSHIDVIRVTNDSINTELPAEPPPQDPDLGKMFTKKEVKQRSDWPEWRLSQFKQLDQYNTQGMFSEPMVLPTGMGASYMHWTYLWKLCGTKKARMVFDGARNRKATALGYTYANSVDAPSERLFWALVAKQGLIAIGADVSNAFAEAPPPKMPLFMYIDEAFRDWWENHLKRPPIPPECNVVRVCKAIQGHPESPRLWEKHIDKILRKMGLQPTRHEPCLYSGTVKGQIVLFLRQVDDFSVAAADANTCSKIIAYINSQMSMDVKDLGLITRFNGVDVFQTKWYIKITCEKYITKMLQHHDWLLKAPPPIHPLPLPSDAEFARSLEQATPPATIHEKDRLRTQMGFNYRQVIGELIWPMVKCRPDYAPHVVKLSQYLDNPAKEHYYAARQLADYLAATIQHGIYYWRDQPVDSLPEGELPTLHHDNYTVSNEPTKNTELAGLVDSDWASDTAKRKSISGIIIMLAGGAIAYKAKVQDVIALSTTEAEFVAACDAAKMILFFRSILEDLGIPQEEATILYEDNNGALMMANAQQPTRRTRHLDIKHFSLLDWVEKDLIILKAISTHDNASDAMTKMLPRQLFYRHSDTFMGRRIPESIRSKFHFSTSTHT